MRRLPHALPLAPPLTSRCTLSVLGPTLLAMPVVETPALATTPEVRVSVKARASGMVKP